MHQSVHGSKVPSSAAATIAFMLEFEVYFIRSASLTAHRTIILFWPRLSMYEIRLIVAYILKNAASSKQL